MAAHGGPFDLLLEFGFRPTPLLDPEPQVSITMSWEHARAMARALQAVVDSYEEQVGPIPDVETVRVVE